MVCALLSRSLRRVTMLHGSVEPEPKTNMLAVSYPSRPSMSLSDLPNVSEEEDSHLHIRASVHQVSQCLLKHLTLIASISFKSNQLRPGSRWCFMEKLSSLARRWTAKMVLSGRGGSLPLFFLNQLVTLISQKIRLAI